jgi:hypothetical protein
MVGKGNQAGSKKPPGLKRTRLSAAEKCAICKRKQEHPGSRYADLVAWFVEEYKPTKAPSCSVLTDILREKEKWLNASNLPKAKQNAKADWSAAKPTLAGLEKALLKWFHSTRHMGPDTQVLSDSLVIEQAKKLGETMDLPKHFKYSVNWLAKWKRLNGISMSDYGQTRSTRKTNRKTIKTENTIAEIGVYLNT